MENENYSFQGQVEIEFQDGTLEVGQYKRKSFCGVRRFFDKNKNFLNATVLRGGKIADFKQIVEF
jgi:hypothetical protein